MKQLGAIKKAGVNLLTGLTLVALSGIAQAQATQAFGNLTSAICNIYSAMSGPFGLALVILMFAIGGISLMIGGKKAIPLMIGAAVGGVILAAAPSFARIFIGGTACGS